MGGETAKVEQAVTAVTPVGDSWVACRSNRYSNRLYYFNTVTGVAAWNLSEEEIEKARAQKKGMNCPEPQEPPADQEKRTATSSRIYNKQIINNQFPKEVYPISPFMIPPYNHVPLAVNAPNPGYNTGVWTIPPGQMVHQVYLAPPHPSVVNQPQSPIMDTTYRDQETPVQSTSTYLSERFTNKTINTSSKTHNRFQRRTTGNNWNRENISNYKHFRKNNGFDLRQYLSVKKMQRRNSVHSEDEMNSGGFRAQRRNSVHSEDEMKSGGFRVQRRNSVHSEDEMKSGEFRAQRRNSVHSEDEMNSGGFRAQRRNSVHSEDEMKSGGFWVQRRNSVHSEDEMKSGEFRAQRRNSVHSEDEMNSGGFRAQRRNSVHSEDEMNSGGLRVQWNSVNSKGEMKSGESNTQRIHSIQTGDERSSFEFKMQGRNSRDERTGGSEIQKEDGAEYSKISEPVASESGSEVDNAASFNEELQKEKLEPNDVDSDWLEENVFVDGRRLKLNVTNLKKMAKAHMDKTCWYIVADMDILISHLNFLNILFNSDEQCCLLVPQQVMAELRQVSERARAGVGVGAGAGAEAERRVASRARRAVSFLSQQLDTGFVVIGDGTVGENDTRCDYLLSCCSNLLEKNFHVVLLSNDEDFKSYKNGTEIPIFTIKELKEFLTKSLPEVKTYRLKPPPCLVKPQCTMPIKITVTNDYMNEKVVVCDNTANNCRDATSTNSEEIHFNDDITNVESCTENVHDDGVTHNRRNYSSSTAKCTIETGVQTDAESVHTNAESVQTDTEPADSRFVFPKVIRCDDKKSLDLGDQTTEKSVPTLPTQAGKREIRLNRSISLKTSASNEDTGVEKKQYKWRRRRIVSSTTMSDSKTPSANSSSIDDNSRDSASIHRSDNVTSTTHHSKPKVDENASEASSSIVEFKIRPELIVEESSTSIISNSTSHQDSETGYGNKSLNDYKQRHLSKYIMFKVSDQKMEDSLRMMADEWVSRFLQIMEEVLTQVLRKDKDFLDGVVYKRHGGGPWTILEALDCIEIKFANTCQIVDAANKLTNILTKLSDNTGRVTTSLSPSEYMEMYNYGVYVIQSLMSVLTHFEDLQSAEQSLAKLLSDIQNPNLDSSHNDTFGDNHPQEIAVNDDILHCPKSIEEPVKDTTSKTQTNNHLFENMSPKTHFNRRIEGETTPTSQIYKATGEANLSPQSPINRSSGVTTSPMSQIRVTVCQKLTPSGAFERTREVSTTPRSLTPTRKTSRTPDAESTPKRPTEKTTPTSQSSRNSKENSISPEKRKYNLRSKTKVLSPKSTAVVPHNEDTEKNTDESFLKKGDSFFSSLNLVKKSCVPSQDTTKTSSVSQPTSTPKDDTNSEDCFIKNVVDRILNSNSNKSDTNMSTPVKFTVQADLEKKIVSKVIEREQLDMDELDYSENYMNQEYFENEEGWHISYDREIHHTESDYAHKIQHTEINFDHESQKTPNFLNNQFYSDKEDVHVAEEIVLDKNVYFNVDDSKFVCDSPLSINNNLDLIFGSLIRQVKETLLIVMRFCQKTREELHRPPSIVRKYELNKKAEEAQNLIANGIKALNIIFDRESSSENNIQSLLKNAGINDFDLNENILKVYRDMIGKALEQALLVQEEVDLIITTIKNKSTR